MTEVVSPVEALSQFVPIDKGIAAHYEQQLGGNGLTTFQDEIIPLAKSILADKPNIYRQTLDTLITVGAQYNPADRASSFWASEVTEDTFAFQRDFDKLLEPNRSDLKPLGFHINTKQLLKEEVSDGRLVPEYLRNGLPFDEEGDEESSNYRVYLASGSVDEVSKFLAGFALIYKTDDWTKRDLRTINSPKFSRTQAIAVADASTINTKYVERGHDMHTQYSSEGNGEHVDLYISHEAVPITTIEVPFTILLPEQIRKLREEGARLYRTGQFDSGNLEFDLEDEEHAADIYANARHQELAIKHALLKLATAT